MGKGRVISFLSFWNSICFKIPQNFIWSFLANIVKLLFYGIQIKHFYPKWQYAFIKFLIGGVSTPILATTILAMGANEQPNTKTVKVPTAKKHETCSSFATMHSKPIKTERYLFYFKLLVKEFDVYNSQKIFTSHLISIIRLIVMRKE